MTWTQLLANNEVQRHKTSKKELDKLRAVIARDMADALSLDKMLYGYEINSLRDFLSRALGYELSHV